MKPNEFGRMLDGHLDAEVVSDLVGGLLTRGQVASVEQHIAVCTLCRDLRDDLAEVRTLLAAEPVGAMPADVAALIDDALSTESLRREQGAAAAMHAGAGTGRGGGVASLSAARKRRSVPRGAVLAKAAAAATIVVGGGVLGVNMAGDLWNGGNEAQSGLAGGPGWSQSAPADSRAKAPAAPDAAGGVQEGAIKAYTKADLPQQVQRLLALPYVPHQLTTKKRATPHGSADGQIPTAVVPVPSCVLAATGRPGVDPLATDLGTYEGQPAAVVVMPDDGKDSGKVDVFVVDRACTTAPGSVREFRELSR